MTVPASKGRLAATTAATSRPVVIPHPSSTTTTGTESPLVPIPSSAEQKGWGRWVRALAALQAAPAGQAYKFTPALDRTEMRSLRSAAAWQRLGLSIRQIPSGRRNLQPEYTLAWISGKVHGFRRAK